MVEHHEQDDRNRVPGTMTGVVPLSLRCDVAALRRSTKGSITGDLHVEVGMFAFPDRGWSDFVVVVLGWWLRALHRLGAGEQSAELAFMDGPYQMDVTRVDQSTYELECLEKARSRVVLCNARVDAMQLVKETERVAARVSEACTAHNWQSPDVEILRSLLSQSWP